MGLFSWLRGKPAPKKKPAAAAPAKTASAKTTGAKAAGAKTSFAKTGGESREELIRRASQIHAEKRKEFDKLDPEVREKLLRQAMGKKNPNDV